MKANFKIDKNEKKQEKLEKLDAMDKKDLTQEEFEDYLRKSGVKGSFMVYRSNKKDEELGLDEL